MAVYAIGDIQGCHREFLQLLERLDFQPDRDRLWLTGDLVNRGPDSLATLRYVRSLGDRVVTVLGNHDLHLLAVAADPARLRRSDTLIPVLEAPDRGELLDWLRHQPLLHHDDETGITMIHAGLAPEWDLATAASCAREVEAVLQDTNYTDFLAKMYGDQPRRWDPALSGHERLRFSVNCLTRLRYCTPDGRLALEHKGAPDTQRGNVIPWFQVPDRRSHPARILFGHWSTLGRTEWPDDNVWGMDSGCVWGGSLSALRIDHEPWALTQLPCPAHRKPGAP